MHEFTIGPLGEWNGTAKVIAKTGSIFGESADVICLTVSSTLEHSPSIWKSLTTQAGPREYKKAFKTAKEGSQYLGHGDILVVDTSKTKLSAKFVFLVVYPDIHHLDKAYRAIFREAAARRCTSVVIPGLGCGRIGNSVHGTCVLACTVLQEIAASNALGSLKEVRFVDVKESIEREFAVQLQAIFGTPKTENATTADVNGGIWSYAKRVDEEAIQKDDCVVCLSSLDEDGEPKEVCELPCGHQYHVQCFEVFIRNPNSKKCCPLCCKYFEIPLGDQPREAQMFINKNYHLKLPGHEDSEFTYEIFYTVPHGVQEASHIRPGKLFTGTQRRAFVPGTSEGTQVMRLLKFAFDRRLVFTVGDSITTGQKNVVVWNNIHHKTNITGGPQKYGYPDPDYLMRVKEDLAAMGITEDMVPPDITF
ncbi:hypothetical protein V3C99_012230 [Haemonchus contortus]|nr:Zinc finger domain containing protein [Haemonchus contortus]